MRTVYIVQVRMKKRIPFGMTTGRTEIFGRYWDKQMAEKEAQACQKECDKINFRTLLIKTLYKVGKVEIETQDV